MRVDVLGPVRVHDADGTDRTPDGALQRRLLSLLVLRRGRAVSTGAAIEALWPDAPPHDPAAALQNHVSRLRRCLPPGAVASEADGYRLDPGTVEVDADRLPALLERLTAADDPDAETELETLLARWHGPAHPELEDTDEGRVEAQRLDELRLRLREARAERRLAAGRTEGLVAELRALADEAPLRETPCALLMEALVASGRRVEALRAYDALRRRLAEELGIEPSPSLVARHESLLQGGGPASEELAGDVPVPATSLLGRDALLADVLRAIDAGRLVTLVGPGGVGKTRLLLEVGRHLGERSLGPAVLCELASTDAASAADAVAAGLGIDARPGVPPAQRVASVIRDRPAVVLLDNCEHVLEPVADLVEHVLARCPGVRAVCTSRERLRVPGEVVLRVPPLDVDDAGSVAVQLFVERARSAAPDFAPDDEELDLVADVVARLDGLPLAIELAAARLHTHDLAEVAAGLDARFDLLSAGYRGSARHGSLHAAVSWSYDLLRPELQDVLCSLAVFAGPFSAEAAAAVCDLERPAAVDALAQLVERSLLLRTSDRRHVLLETIRAFGAEQLEASGRAEDARRRHARHHVAWTEQVQRQLATPGAAPLPAIDAALPELRSALSWLLAAGEVVDAGRLVCALVDFGFFRLRPDVLGWAAGVTAADPADASPHAPMMWVARAYADWMAGDLVASGAHVQRALRTAAGPDGELPADVHAEIPTVRGNTALFAGRLEEAQSWYRIAVEAAGDHPVRRPFARATALLALGYAEDPSAADEAAAVLAEAGDEATPCAAYAWYCAGEAVAHLDVELAAARYAQALELASATHTSAVTGLAGASKASIDARHGDPDVAARAYRELIPHWRRAGMWSTQWTMLRSIAGLLERRGATRDAAVLLGAVRATQAGHRVFGADEAALDELAQRLRLRLGPAQLTAALAEGATLDGDAAVEVALRAL